MGKGAHLSTTGLLKSFYAGVHSPNSARRFVDPQSLKMGTSMHWTEVKVDETTLAFFLLPSKERFSVLVTRS
jgi:hypothetical protein